MKIAKCPVCESPALTSVNGAALVFNFRCYRCGDFRCDRYAHIALKSNEWTDQQIANASNYVFRSGGILLTSDEIDRLASVVTPSVTEKSTNLLKYLALTHPFPGESFYNPEFSIQSANKAARDLSLKQADIHLNNLPDAQNTLLDPKLAPLRWLAVSTASDEEEFHWLIIDYLFALGFLSQGHSDGQLKISPKGWQEIERLQKVVTNSRFGFVAMSFRPEFIPLYDKGIAPGITAAGYEPKRIDRTEHNNRIDDEIIASIKQSRFVVSDFTVNRGGIYFEAGYGLGAGLEVIWLVRENCLAEVHFDNRQYNFITWQDGEWEQLAKRLQMRIEATLGRGPIR